MHYPFPPELDRLIQEKMSSGHYQSEDELLMDAMHALEDIHAQHDRLRSEIVGRLAEAGKGLSRPLDRELFKKEARRRLAEENQG